MRSTPLFAVLVLLLLLFSLNQGYCAENYVEYRVQINGDASASWTIVVVSDANVTVDSWEGFQEKIFVLVETAVNVTGREMVIAPETINMETVISWDTQSKTTEFRFKWLNFSVPEGDTIVFGDVFGVPSFFYWLYGDGRLLITYPIGYSVLEFSPEPDRHDAGLRAMEWFRTQDFLNGNPSIALGSEDSSVDVGGEWMPYVILGLVVAFVASMAGFFFVRRRRSKNLPGDIPPAGIFILESDEEKVTKFVRSSGGRVPQSDIGEHFGFSKAKTSQLLSSLESKGVVARYKSGRDKIVTLTEHAEGDKS